MNREYVNHSQLAKRKKERVLLTVIVRAHLHKKIRMKEKTLTTGSTNE